MSNECNCLVYVAGPLKVTSNGSSVHIMQAILSFEERLRRVRESLRVEKAAHAATLVQLHQSRERVAELEELLRTAGSEPPERAGAHFEAPYEEVDCNAPGHSKGDGVTQFPNVVRGKDMEVSGDGGVAKDLDDSSAEKDVGNDMLEPPTQKMAAGECAADVGVSVGDANVGSTAPVRDSVAEDGTGNTSRGGSASTIAKRIKGRGRSRKAAAARCSPYTTPTRRGNAGKGKRRTVGVNPAAGAGHSQAVHSVSIDLHAVVDVVPLATLNVSCSEHVQRAHGPLPPVDIATITRLPVSCL